MCSIRTKSHGRASDRSLQGLRLLFNGPLTYGWPKTANTGPGFNGRSPVQVMCDGGIPAMMKVRQHIDALQGGV